MHESRVKEAIIKALAAGHQVSDIKANMPYVGQTYIYEIRKMWLATKMLESGEPVYQEFKEPAYRLPRDATEPAVVGTIGDTHEPFAHPRYFEFVRDTFREWGVDTVVHIGDLVDNHAISFHESDPDGKSAGDEYKEALENLDKWITEFPYVSWCTGNHDKLPQRRIKASGLPKHLIRQNIYGLPDGWVEAPYFIIDNVHYSHGIGSAGINGHRNLALKKGMSCVIGHCHSFAGVAFLPTPYAQRWAMNVGCGIDVDRYAFEYQKDFAVRPTLGCGIVINNTPHFIPMDMEKYGRITD